MFSLALKNILQKKIRTLITVLGVALATGTLFSLLSFENGYKRGLQQELNQLGAHILVVPKGCPYDAASLALHGANWPCYLKSEYLSQVVFASGVAVASPVFMSASYGPDRARDVLVGITSNYLQLKTSWQITGAFPTHSGEALLGSRKAEEMKASLSSSVSIASLPSMQLHVSGVLKPTNGPDDDFIFVRLGDAQSWFKQEGHLTHILVKLSDPDLLEKTVEQLRGCDAGMQMNIIPLAHLFATIRNVINSTRYLLLSIAAIALLVAGTALVNTMLMAVLERTREIGVLRAIGASRSQVFRLFLCEALLLCSGGALVGLVLSFAGSRGIETWIRQQLPYSPGSALITLHLPSILFCVAFALVVGCIAGLIPAIHASRLAPVDAFRAHAAY